jgi:hypothetical protein
MLVKPEVEVVPVKEDDGQMYKQGAEEPSPVPFVSPVV